MELIAIFNLMILASSILLLMFNWVYKILVLRVNRRFGLKLSGRVNRLLTINIFTTLGAVLVIVVTSLITMMKV
jgi:hypothetical protein